jgi:hypothetical protein
VTLRARLTVPGRPEQVATARATVALALGPGHPCADAAVLITSDSLNLSNSSFSPFCCAFVSAGWTGCQGLPHGRAGG